MNLFQVQQSGYNLLKGIGVICEGIFLTKDSDQSNFKNIFPCFTKHKNLCSKYRHLNNRNSGFI